MKESFSHQILALNILRKDLTGPAWITVTPELEGQGLWWAAHSWTLVGAGEEPSPKRKEKAVWDWLLLDF